MICYDIYQSQADFRNNAWKMANLTGESLFFSVKIVGNF